MSLALQVEPVVSKTRSSRKSGILLLSVTAGLGGHHSCVECIEKAHGKLWFVFWIARTAEIRCFRNALSLTGLQPGADLFWPSCCCCCWLQVSVVDTADSTASRRPTASFGLCCGSHGQPRYVAFATLFLLKSASKATLFSALLWLNP